MSWPLFSSHRQFRQRLYIRIQFLQLVRRGLHFDTAPHSSPPPPSSKASKPTDSLYLDSIPPTQDQCLAATQFFRSLPPRIAWVANEWQYRKSDTSTTTSTPTSIESLLTPEIAFLGRSNSGKSSLLNALLMSPSLCRVGPKPGKTVAMHAWALAPSDPRTGGARKGDKGDTDAKVVVLDMPGYGHGSRDEWGRDITKYLTRRKQLKRAFVLINPKHGVKDSDELILGLLRKYGISHQIIASKCDGVKASEMGSLLEGVRQEILDGQKRDGGMGVALEDILAVGKLGDGSMNKKVRAEGMIGIEEVRWAILRAAGLDEYAYHKLPGSRRKKADVRRTIELEPSVAPQLSIEQAGSGGPVPESRPASSL